MAKQKSSQSKRTRKHVTHNQTHILLKKGILVYSLLVFIFFVLISLSAFALVESKNALDFHERRQDVAKIYENLNLDRSYWPASKVEQADSKSYFANYGRDASRSDTFDDLNRRISSAGFIKINSTDKFTLAREDNYKNDKGQTITVTIETAQWHNATIYGTEFPSPESKQATEQGPVYVTIIINPDEQD